MDRTEAVLASVVGGLILLYFVSRKSGGGGSSTLAFQPAGGSASDSALLAAKEQTFGALASATMTLEANRMNNLTAQDQLAVQSAVEQSRISAALESVRLQTQAQQFAVSQQQSTQNTKNWLDSIPVIGGAIKDVLGIFGI